MSEKLPFEEREKRLLEASAQYMSRKIDADELKKREEEYGTNFSETTLGLARERMKIMAIIRRFLKRIWSLILQLRTHN